MKIQLLSGKRLFRIYLVALGLASILLAIYATSPYGAGVGTDGAIQMSTADNLLAGNGFYDYAGEPFVRWPPLYPLLLALLSATTHMDTFRVGWHLNMALLGVITWLGGMHLFLCFQKTPLWAFIGGLVIASSVSLLSLSANIGTDPLFIALTLACLLAANRYLSFGSQWAWLVMALFACLASLQRLPGVTLAGTGAILILYANRSRFWKGVREALVFSVITILPLAVWVIDHNFLRSSTLFGVYLFYSTDPFLNLQDTLLKILHWFLPYSLLAQIPFSLQITAPILALLTVYRRGDWERLRTRLANPHVLSSLVFVGLYLGFLVLTVNSADTRYSYFDRYQAAVLIPILILILTALQKVVNSRMKRHSRLAHLIVLAAFAIWLIYPVYSLYKYTTKARASGEPTYNKYNTSAMSQSKIVQILLESGQDNSRTIYSNYPAAAWFFTRKSVLNSPRGPIVGEIRVNELVNAYQGWPWDKPGYLVWFLPNKYDHILEPRVLRKLADLKLIYRGEDGEVYRVRALLP